MLQCLCASQRAACMILSGHSFYHAGSGVQTQGIKLGHEYLYALNQPDSPIPEFPYQYVIC